MPYWCAAVSWHDFDYARLQLLDELAQWEQVRTRVFENYAALDALERADLLVTYTMTASDTGRNATGRAGELRRARRSLAGSARHQRRHRPAGCVVSPSTGLLEPSVSVATVLGSQFLAHPPIAPYTVEITAPDHPLVAGIEPFEDT